MSIPSLKVVSIPTHMTSVELAKLARDVVMDIRETSDHLATYNLTLPQFARIKAHPYYQRVVEQFSIEWNSPLSTADRIRLIAAAMLEEGLPRIGSRMIDEKTPGAVAVDTAKLFAKIAGVGEGRSADTTSPGEKFTITINLGEDRKLEFTKDITPQAKAAEGGTEEIRSEPQRAADPYSVPNNREG